MTTGPNVLLVVFDTARADVFEPYGAPVGATPALAQLANRGRAVPRAYAPASWTVPSHAAMFTGLLPRSAGLNHVGGGQPTSFRAALAHHEDRLLASVLGRRGWETAGISANTWIHERSGFHLGFDEFHSIGSERAKAFARPGARSQARWYVEALRANLDDGAGRIEDKLARWTTQRGTEPFFWFVNLVECHSPYLPPKPCNSAGPIGRLRAAHDAREHLGFESIWMSSVGGFRVPDDAMARMRRQYVDSIHQLDAWLARVLDGLDRSGILDDTVVIVTSDHGENLGEDDLLGHAFSLDDRLIHVPLVIGGPLDLDPGDDPVSLVELPHLLGNALGIDHPWERPAWTATPVAQFDAPGHPDDQRVLDAVRAWGLGEDAVRRMCTSFTCATDGRRKLVRRDGHDLVLDLGTDPLEQRPVAVDPARSPDLAALQAALDAAEAEERPAIHDTAPSGVSAAETARLEEQMRLLGYL